MLLRYLSPLAGTSQRSWVYQALKWRLQSRQMNDCDCGRMRRFSFFRRQSSNIVNRINMTIGKPARLRIKTRKMQNRSMSNKKTVRMISLKVSSLRMFSSFSKGRVALEPQAGQGGVILFFDK